jgi:hypothetical protein
VPTFAENEQNLRPTIIENEPTLRLLASFDTDVKIPVGVKALHLLSALQGHMIAQMFQPLDQSSSRVFRLKIALQEQVAENLL